MGKKISSIVAALALGLALIPSGARADLIDFDGIAATCCYADVTPGGPRGPMLSFPDVDLDGGVVMDNTGWGGLATSPPNLYGTSDFLALHDGSLLPGVITGVFSASGVFSSIDLDIINGFGAARFILTALDAANVEVDSEVISLDGFGSGPGAVGHVSVSGAGIKSFTVTSTQGAGSKDFAIDTIEVGRTSVPEPGSIGMFGAMGLGMVSLVIRRRRA